MGTCPGCGGRADKVIYLGLPMRLCSDVDGCACLSGFWSFVAFAFPIHDGEHFAFMVYDGSYWSALRVWLMGES